MAASDLIQFKRGTLANLQTKMAAKSGEDGCFYLTVDGTVDSSRLFIGRADGSIVPVNQGIIKVASVAALENNTVEGNFQPGDFAYVEEGNILAIRSANKWIQINTQAADVHLEELGLSVAVADGVATITTTGEMSSGTSVSDAFTMTGAKGITVSGSGKAVTITGDEYSLSSAAVTGNQATIQLASDSVADAGSIAVKAGTDISLSGAADEIVITGTSVSTAAFSNQANGFKLAVEQSDGRAAVEATVDPVISYGGDSANLSSAHFENGTATLSVYTKTEIDNKLKGLDGMTYKGTVGTGGSAATSVSGISTPSIGDTFMASSDLTDIPLKSGTGTAKTGDLLIANSTAPEGADGTITSGLYYDIVPSGDDYDTTYTVTSQTHGIKIEDSRGNLTGGIALDSDSLITLTDAGTTDKTVTVGHATVTTAITAGTAETQSDNASLTFTTVAGVTTDGHGHITDIQTKQITVKDTNATLDSVTNTVEAGTGADAGKKATIKTTVVSEHANGSDTDTKEDSFALASDNLTITTSGKEVKANFVWGTF